MLRHNEIALPEDTDIYALYIVGLKMLCINVCAEPDANLIIIWRGAKKRDD